MEAPPARQGLHDKAKRQRIQNPQKMKKKPAFTIRIIGEMIPVDPCEDEWEDFMLTPQRDASHITRAAPDSEDHFGYGSVSSSENPYSTASHRNGHDSSTSSSTPSASSSSSSSSSSSCSSPRRRRHSGELRQQEGRGGGGVEGARAVRGGGGASEVAEGAAGEVGGDAGDARGVGAGAESQQTKKDSQTVPEKTKQQHQQRSQFAMPTLPGKRGTKRSRGGNSKKMKRGPFTIRILTPMTKVPEKQLLPSTPMTPFPHPHTLNAKATDSPWVSNSRAPRNTTSYIVGGTPAQPSEPKDDESRHGGVKPEDMGFDGFEFEQYGSMKDDIHPEMEYGKWMHSPERDLSSHALLSGGLNLEENEESEEMFQYGSHDKGTPTPGATIRDSMGDVAEQGPDAGAGQTETEETKAETGEIKAETQSQATEAGGAPSNINPCTGSEASASLVASIVVIEAETETRSSSSGGETTKSGIPTNTDAGATQAQTST